MSRETAIVVALGALAVASAMASWGAWLLLWRDRKARGGGSGTATPMTGTQRPVPGGPARMAGPG